MARHLLERCGQNKDSARSIQTAHGGFRRPAADPDRRAQARSKRSDDEASARLAGAAMTPSTPAAPLSISIAAPFAALVCGAFAMGLSPIFVRLADVGPFTSAFWRVALALPVLYAWMRFSERGGRESRASFSRATILTGLAFAGDLFFWHLSIVTTSVANATFFATTAPIWVVLFAWLIFRERASAAVLSGLGFCIAGGAALLAQSFGVRPGGAVGDLYGLVTGVFFGLYFLAVQAARRGSSAARVIFESTAITAALLLAVALIVERRLLPHSLSGVLALLALAWISHAGGQGLLAVALGRLPAAFSSLVIFLDAIAAACFAWIALGEPVTLVQAGGGLMILIGIYIARPR
jgi:drug/metabolite transporter (DMT)-like permease